MHWEPLVWVVTILMMAVGLVGVFIPVLPGLTLIFAAAVLHKLLLPAYLSWWTIAAMGVLTVLATIAGAILAPLGAKKFGASRWGTVGAVAGMGVGLFFMPFGLILGPLIGAVVGELLFARRKLKDAAWAGAGVSLGLALAAALHLATALILIGLFVVNCVAAG